jgi:hypothetical protein
MGDLIHMTTHSLYDSCTSNTKHRNKFSNSSYLFFFNRFYSVVCRLTINSYIDSPSEHISLNFLHPWFLLENHILPFNSSNSHTLFQILKASMKPLRTIIILPIVIRIDNYSTYKPAQCGQQYSTNNNQLTIKTPKNTGFTNKPT